MTTDASKLEAGRETDAAVARALGWRDIGHNGAWKSLMGKRPVTGYLDTIPRFSTNASAALTALEEWQEKTGFRVTLCHNPSGAWRLWIESNAPLNSSWHEGPTLYLAICRLIVASGRDFCGANKEGL